MPRMRSRPTAASPGAMAEASIDARRTVAAARHGGARRASFRLARPSAPMGATLLTALLLAAGAALAHQQKEAITRVLFNERTGQLEVMHRFLLHDAEHAVRELFDPRADLLRSEETRARFAAYVHQRFALRDQAGRSLPLTPVGHEIEGRFLWIYAETPIPAGLEALTIAHRALRDLWPDQVNLVNVERGGAVESALFAGGEGVVTIRFGH